MVINSLFIIRGLIVILELATFFYLCLSNNLLKKVMAWAVFQTSIVLLWLSSSYRYHNHLNPLPQAAAFLIVVFSLGILGIMLIFVLGILRRYDSLEVEKTDREDAA